MRARGRRVPHGKLRAATLRLRIEILWVLLLAAAAGYGGVVLLAWLGQEKLLFYPRPVESKPVAPAGWRIEDVTFTTRDGTRLAGVLVLPPVPKPPLVIYFGGNAEEVTAYAPMSNEYYGESRGAARELSRLRRQRRQAGRSGAGIGWPRALRLGARAGRYRCDRASRSTDAALAPAYRCRSPRRDPRSASCSRRPSSARARWPRSSIRGFRYRCCCAIHSTRLRARPDMKTPALFLMGTIDTLVPMWQSEQLAGLWGGPAERVVFEGFGHNDIQRESALRTRRSANSSIAAFRRPVP